MKRLFLIFVTFGAIGVCATTLYGALFSAAESEIPVPSHVAASAQAADVDPSELPARLVIPSIEVDAHVQHVGIAQSGNMAVPTNYTDVGWYRYGTVPGYLGSAVMAGHLDNGVGLPGVFKKLDQLRTGDTMYVETRGGKRITYRVVDVQTYPYTEVPTEIIFNANDAGRLNLITCSGAWIQSQKTYDTRLVVYAVLAR